MTAIRKMATVALAAVVALVSERGRGQRAEPRQQAVHGRESQRRHGDAPSRTASRC